MTDTVVVADAGPENTGYRFSWGLAIAGGVAATAVTFFLLTLGSGFGLLLVNPTSHDNPSLPTFLTGGAIYFIAAQAFGFAIGGHLAGRLLGPLLESREQENFRAEAHGLIAWAVAVLATLTMVAFMGMSAASTGSTVAALYGATAAKNDTTPSAYIVDTLFRPGERVAQAAPMPDTTAPARPAASADGNAPAPAAANPPAQTPADAAAARAEAGRIVDAGLGLGLQPAPADRLRLTDLIATQAGVSKGEAAQRVDRMHAEISGKMARAADIARKTASYTAFWLALSLIFGAAVSIVSAMAARHEDDRQSV